MSHFTFETLSPNLPSGNPILVRSKGTVPSCVENIPTIQGIHQNSILTTNCELQVTGVNTIKPLPFSVMDIKGNIVEIINK
jgi:hypothetical protein